jgi:3-phenylpropionate/cinnamic acid dioxygenase small subunit
MVGLSEVKPAGRKWTIDDVLLQHEIEQFYYDEAALLDEWRVHEWLTLLTDDLEYFMPVRTTRARGEQDEEFTKPGESAFFDDNKRFMEERVRKLDTGFSWAEDPPSRTRRYITNVRIRERISESEIRVTANFFIYRTRLAQDEDWWAGRREDTLRKVDGEWKIARRHIFLDQVSLRSKNLSIFF